MVMTIGFNDGARYKISLSLKSLCGALRKSMLQQIAVCAGNCFNLLCSPEFLDKVPMDP